MSIKPILEGFHAITPYLFAQGAARLIDFISAAFEGELIFQQKRPDGAVMHATMRIGDSMLMLADPTPEFGAMRSSIYFMWPIVTPSISALSTPAEFLFFR
jgi:PhnB protein